MGRGKSKAAGGRSDAPYGTEYKTLHQLDNIKYVTPTSGATTAPMYTKTSDRIYATVDGEGDVKYITFYDDNLNRYKQIDVKGQPHKVDGKLILPHTHYGYLHDENGTFKPTQEEVGVIDKVLIEWYNFTHGK